MKKIVIIDHEPLTKRRVEIFCINELLERGCDLEFWDMSQYFHRGLSIVDSVEAAYRFRIYSLHELKEKLLLTDIEHTVFIIETFRIYEYRKFFRLLNDFQCFTVKIELYASTESVRVKFWNKFKGITFQQLFWTINARYKSLLNKLYFKYYHIGGYNLYLSSGNDPLIDIPINHPDWEKAQNCLDLPPLLGSKRYAVFCDEYFPLHSDLKYVWGIKIRNIEKYAQKYRKSLCDFFSEIEECYGIEVVIAAHPKAEYKGDEWGGRLIYKYKTCELIKDCEFVLFHNSTSRTYAYIFNKPLLMITNTEYMNVKLSYRYQLLVSHRWGIPLYNVSLKKERMPVLLPLKDRDDYIYSFLTAVGIEGKKNADIFYETFAGL